eukprot:1503431-Pleurochrysis_carterae.AAC.2
MACSASVSCCALAGRSARDDCHEEVGPIHRLGVRRLQRCTCAGKPRTRMSRGLIPYYSHCALSQFPKC